MKSAARLQQTQEDTPEQDDLTPTNVAAPSEASDQRPTTRPQLVRSPPARLSESAAPPTGQHDGSTADDGQSDVVHAGAELSKPSMQRQASRSEGEKLADLKKAVSAKLMAQARKRSSHGTQKRVSPIAEESSTGKVSPSLNAAFASPLEPVTRPLSTLSTQSTQSNLSAQSTQSAESTESNRTVRASVAPTPAADSKSVHTPSYPFPYVPGTPRWSSSFHQPFTTLSPTTSMYPSADSETPGKASTGVASGGSTLAATVQDFMPASKAGDAAEDPRYPTPSLYDLVLSLNAEPGLEQWWEAVTSIMHEQYRAERVTLVMPLDPTDIENVPWAQKATFSMNGREEFVPHRTVLEQTSHVSRPDIAFRAPSTDAPQDFQMQKLHPERLRPRLESRHSYAGHIRDPQTATLETVTKSGARPLGPQRTVTHAPGMPGGIGPGRVPPRRLPSATNFRNASLTDPDFSSVAGGFDAGPYSEVFDRMRALDHEARPLIEPGGVNRVLERGRVVTITRDYTPDSSESNNSRASNHNESGETPAADTRMEFGDYRRVFATENASAFRRDYEEYEQYPASPWAQSPAPSPAIQADEETNPFFASEEQQVEDSFNPTTNTPKDYRQYTQVDAIGVDRASTIIHIPLVHPILSQPMQSLRMRQSADRPGPPKRSNTVDLERKAPIAILSVLSETVPYPPNFTRSLKLLAPHLATSLAIQQHFPTQHAQAVTLRHRRTTSGHNVNDAPMTIEPASLDDILHAEVEDAPGSMSGSMTSPSDYSGRSKHSPLGTPGWPEGSWNISRSAAGTPGYTGSEMVDNYFEAKKRSGGRSASNASGTAHATPAKISSKPPSSDSKSSLGKDNMKTPRSEQKLKESKSLKEERSPIKALPESERRAAALVESPPRPNIRHTVSHFADHNAANLARRHSLLHSYGADFESSFGGIPSSLEPATPGAGSHARQGSYGEDMPPPSERLLRTIIDSVPVQIWTARPDIGQVTWVNSKFLTYRGLGAREVLADPWAALHPEDRADFMASWTRSLRTAQQLQQKVRLRRFDKEFRWFYVRAAPLKDRRQKIVHWIGTMMDFHEQHLAELNAARSQETAASEAKYRALANSSPQIVFAVNKHKGVTFCNTQWLHYSGQAEAQALGVGFMDHVHADDLAKCRLPTFDEGSNLPKGVPTSVPPDLQRTDTNSAQSSSGSSDSTERGAGTTSSDSSPITQQPSQRKLSKLAETGILKVARDADGRPSYSTEVRLKSKDGNYRWHLVRVLLAEPMLQNVIEEETWYGTCTDINDHKTLERDLKETMDEKSRFLSNMSHEIRTPLNGITGMVNFLIDSSLTAEQMEHVNIIRASTEGLRGLINDILDLSKAEAGMIHLNHDWLYPRALIEEVNDLTSAMAIDKGLELNYVVEEDVPPQVKGDRFRIRQVLLNVIGNAIKFTEEGEVFVRCSQMEYADEEVRDDEMFIKFEIIDTGRGFTEKEAEHLFKRFSQIDGSSTRQHGGTGLGLVISRQLAQLHGGDMSAKGTPGKGSIFTFFIKMVLPSKKDQPPVPPPTPGAGSVPKLPMLSRPASFGTPNAISASEKSPAKPSPTENLMNLTRSPSPYTSPDIRGPPSSGSSAPSITTTRTDSLRSEHSSASSFSHDTASEDTTQMKLSLPIHSHSQETVSTGSNTSGKSTETIKRIGTSTDITLTLPTGVLAAPPMFSILVICPLKYSREATVQHIDKTLPKNVPHQVTAREHVEECYKILSGDDPIVFSHIVLFLQDVDEIRALMRRVLSSTHYSGTTIVVISDLAQRRRIMEQAPEYNYDLLGVERRLRFVFKPLKPSRFAVIFDPQKEREMSTDRNQDNAQQVALTQKQVFEDLKKRFDNKGMRVLLVEDNRVNQMVVLKFLAKINLPVDTALDGVQCTDKMFSHPHDYYNIILCDLHMPNKDGYQTCKEIRKWERKNKYKHLPIIALSANVLGDVYQKCVEAGFNSYLTKPVEFKELSQTLVTFLDPEDPKKPHEFMSAKEDMKGNSATR
ncbi:hypothetical protein EJ03DRAFT_67127 [Teratosphaeria nubilosa]|uniref:histidine kinase n=1 Tax=Teratosphaeria nubilosa TaxID=161662 RepID=A0A6G1LE13_9PEZI|nr:hypothetical protein EJ03DRAFT_67127 [Teratosphaeria nubilosa]